MSKLTVGDRVQAIKALHDRLEQAIEATPKGLSDEEIQDAWLFVCDQMGVKPKVGTSSPDEI